jgi:phenylpropionate dioxygenase-like ring-hydroxylating dioxygenase large terminal subunit
MSAIAATIGRANRPAVVNNCSVRAIEDLPIRKKIRNLQPPLRLSIILFGPARLSNILRCRHWGESLPSIRPAVRDGRSEVKSMKTDRAPKWAPEQGIVSRNIFSDPEIYQQELEQIFRKCWLFVGHEATIPSVNDYIINYMGEDSVIVTRAANGKFRVFLNSCPHRGNKVCLYDRGNAKTFTCSYHGWSFNSEGELQGVPFHQEAYLGELDRSKFGLVEVPRVENFCGLIFACWDDEAMPLEEYLGDTRWYIENLFLSGPMGGVEFLTGRQRFVCPGNWKVAADNFVGDHYHTMYTHASVIMLDQQPSMTSTKMVTSPVGPFEVIVGGDYSDSPIAHGLGGLRIGETIADNDEKLASKLGPDAVDWIKERRRRMREAFKDMPNKPTGFIRGNIFPNFSIVGGASALTGRGLYQWHPKGPHKTHAMLFCAVEKEAPDSVKRAAAINLIRGNSAGGLFGQDDMENFERVTENTLSPTTQRLSFNFSMGVGHETNWPGSEDWKVEGLPGLIGPRFTELNQRGFYSQWGRFMGWPSAAPAATARG